MKEQKTAKWLNVKTIGCSECTTVFHTIKDDPYEAYPYCPNCRAKMVKCFTGMIKPDVSPEVAEIDFIATAVAGLASGGLTPEEIDTIESVCRHDPALAEKIKDGVRAVERMEEDPYVGGLLSQALCRHIIGPVDNVEDLPVPPPHESATCHVRNAEWPGLFDWLGPEKGWRQR
jgi:hypothetical protein